MISEFETKLLGLMMMVIMLGMGASLTWRDFLIAFRKPKGVLIGIVCQYGIMPLLGFTSALVLGLSPGVAVGLLLISCMPGGTTSNIFTYFSKGVLALSIMMTSVSTLLALFMVPTLLEFYSQAAGITGNFKIPAVNVAQVLVVLLVPTVLGMVLRKANPNIGASIELLGGFLSVLVIVSRHCFFGGDLGASQLWFVSHYAMAGLRCVNWAGFGWHCTGLWLRKTFQTRQQS